MTEPFRTRTFKSGNSVALRLPKGLDVSEGVEMNVVRDAPMSFRFEPADEPCRTIDVSGFWGKAPWLEPSPRDGREFEERPSAIARREARDGA